MHLLALRARILNAPYKLEAPASASCQCLNECAPEISTNLASQPRELASTSRLPFKNMHLLALRARTSSTEYELEAPASASPQAPARKGQRVHHLRTLAKLVSTNNPSPHNEPKPIQPRRPDRPVPHLDHLRHMVAERRTEPENSAGLQTQACTCLRCELVFSSDALACAASSYFIDGIRARSASECITTSTYTRAPASASSTNLGQTVVNQQPISSQ